MMKKLKEIIRPKTEMDDYRMVFSTEEVYLAEIMKLKLNEEKIHVFMINKQDRTYNNFGSIELYVKAEEVVRAKYLIDKTYE